MNFKSLALLACAVALAACEKNGVQDITGSAPGAAVMFFNLGVDAPGVNFYANDQKVTAIGSADSTMESPEGTDYGDVAAGGNYAGIEPGQYTLTGNISDTTADHNLAISSLSADLADGKFYSYFQSGVYDPVAKTVDAFIVEDPLPALDRTQAYVRFVNALAGSNPLALSVKDPDTGAETAIGGPVAYKSAGEYVAVPSGVYDIVARDGATDSITETEISFSAGNVYTVSAFGDITLAGTDDDNAPALDNTANR